MKKRLLSIILIIVVWITSISYDGILAYAEEDVKKTSGVCGDNLKWTLSDDGTLIISGIGEMENWNVSGDEEQEAYHETPWDCGSIKYVIIEDGVTSIGGNAFSRSENLVSVTIPASVKSIGNYAFSNCENLSDISIPDNITSVGRYAFHNTAFTSLNIPASLEKIGEAAFSSWKLNNITISEKNNNYCVKDGILYDKNISMLIQAPVNIKDIAIPNTVSRICNCAVKECSKLETLLFPESVIEIGNYAFWECSNLTNISFPEKLDIIGDNAFGRCYSLTSVSIPKSVSSIGLAAFSYCLRLEDIYIPDGIDGVNESIIRNTAFFDNKDNWEKNDKTIGALYLGNYLIAGTAEENFVVKRGTVEISDFAFGNILNEHIKSISIPDSVQIIGDKAFDNCTGLTSLEIPNSVRVIGEYAFNNCKGLTNITIPDTIQKIGTGAFDGCKKLDEITLPGNAKLGGYLFPDNISTLNIKGTYKEEWCKALAGSDFKEINYNRTVLNNNIKDNKDNLVHYAKKQICNIGQARYSTYSDETGYTKLLSTDKLHEAKDPDGNLFAFYGDKDNVLVVSGITGRKPFKIENPGFTFGAATIGSDGYYYIFWGRDIPDDAIAYSKDEENIQVCKYDSSGKLVNTLGIPLSYSGAQFPFSAGNANIVYSNGYLCVFFNVSLAFEVRWLFKPLSKHQQASEYIAINAETMELAGGDNGSLNGVVGNSIIGKSGYVYDISMIPTSYGFAAIQRAGANKRGIRIIRMYIYDGKISTVGPSKLIYHCSGNEENESRETYTYMGGLAKSSSSYALAGKSGRKYTSSTYRNSKLKTDVCDVFVRIMDQSLAKYDSEFAGITRKDEATGEDADYNVIWLTHCDEKEKAGSVKIVTLEDGSYCVLWEKMVNGKFDSIHYVILDELGNILRRETAVYGARLSNTSIQPVVQGNILSWAVADKESGAIIWYSVNLDNGEQYDKNKVSSDNAQPTDSDGSKNTHVENTQNDSAIKINGYNYKKLYMDGNKNEVQFTGVNNKSNIVIPGTIKISGKKYKVTSIADNVVRGNRKVEKITIGANIKVIGKNAFRDCRNLKDIVIKSKKLTTRHTGKGVFKGINSKAVIKVPAGKIVYYKKIIRASGAGKNVKIINL